MTDLNEIRKLIDILKERRTDWKDRGFIQKLYKRRETAGIVNESLTDWLEMERE